MTDSNCRHVQQRLDDLLDGYLPREQAAAAELHISACTACTAARAAAGQLRAALQQMPVPEPRPGFADAALAAATRHTPAPAKLHPTGQPGRWTPAPWRRMELWLGATVGAAAAAALMVMLWGVPQRGELPEEPAGVRVTLHEAREIGVAIDSETALPGATLTVVVEGGIDLVGFGERREVRWQTDLDAGTNILSLPIIAHSLEDGRLTAFVEHGDRSRRIDVTVRVDAPPAD
jgi:anti-sigma factor RsiW